MSASDIDRRNALGLRSYGRRDPVTEGSTKVARTFSGKRLRGQREAAGLRLEHIAIALRRSTRQIQAYESGESVPPTAVLIALADQFGCPVDDLIDEPAVAA